MGKNKLKKFEEMAGFPHVYEYPYATLQDRDCPLKGAWQAEVFGNDRPVTLELGCGRGEYTVELGKLFPERNFIGIDIKGSRMWTGAKESLETGMTNVAFLRTRIELLPRFFAPGEVSEIWLTFPDPQMKKVNKRLTGTRFMRLYSQILADGGRIHLKTDSPFMYAYTCAMICASHYPVVMQTDDLYHSNLADGILSIRTGYEQQWIERGLSIKYVQFVCEPRDAPVEPCIEIAPDPYRSYNRSRRSADSSVRPVMKE
ncbi:MAG: tRNA (guanosine(46)-N7)-methyltransferase TrmB [Tannerella sp.]|jgi:tRNA (guanine-N7-)-methyltransferase|nr:tRNA (guanosine(46)-N7)-methyltransferase TrmB [Tannerella sp.]